MPININSAPCHFDGGTSRFDTLASPAIRRTTDHLPHQTRLDDVPSELIQALAATYLSEYDRRSLSWVNRRLHDYLRSMVYLESVTRHTPLVRTASGVEQVLREISQLPRERQLDWKIELVRQFHNIPVPLRRRAIEAVLRSAPEDMDKGRILSEAACAVPAYLPGCRYFSQFDADGELNSWIWRVAAKYTDEAQLLALGGLMSNSAIRGVRPYGFQPYLSALDHPFPQEVKNKFLRGLICSFLVNSDAMRTDKSALSAWNDLWQIAISLPDGSRGQPIRLLASTFPVDDSAGLNQHWKSMLKCASNLPEADRIEICIGLSTILERMPKQTIAGHFHELWQTCEKLPWQKQTAVLTNLARLQCNDLPSLGELLIETTLRHIPAGERMGPLRAIIQEYWVGIDNPSLPASIKIDRSRLTEQERGILLGRYASHNISAIRMDDVLDEVVQLPTIYRHWAIAGAISNLSVTSRAGGGEWIARRIMPLVEEISPQDRTDILSNLCALALFDVTTTPTPLAGRLTTPETWQRTQTLVSELPATQQAQILLNVSRTTWSRKEPAWTWILTRVSELPAHLRAPILADLFMRAAVATDVDIEKFYRTIPALWTVPRIFRADPLQAVTRWRKKLGFMDSLKTFCEMRALRASLPPEDRI